MGSKHFLADLMMMLLLLLVFLLDLRERKREGDYSPSIKGSQFSFPLLSHLEMEFIIMMVLSVTYFYMLFYTFQFLLSCAQSNLIQSKCMTYLDKVSKKISNLVKILLALIIFYKMNTDNDTLLKF